MIKLSFFPNAHQSFFFFKVKLFIYSSMTVQRFHYYAPAFSIASWGLPHCWWFFFLLSRALGKQAHGCDTRVPVTPSVVGSSRLRITCSPALAGDFSH